MKVAVVGIGKMENHYIKEWVTHYLTIGVDKIYLGDNNNVDGEFFDEILLEEIKNGQVEIINVRGRKQIQLKYYIDVYNAHNHEYNWMGFFDIDELLDTGHYGTVKNMLTDSIYDNYEVIRIPWKIFDDSNLVKVVNGDYSLKKRFTHFTKARNCKAFVRCGTNLRYGITPHGPLGLKSCDPYGKECFNGFDRTIYGSLDAQFLSDKVINGDIWLDHYFMKTLEEYVTNKMVRLYPDKPDDLAMSQLTLKRFWAYNEKTDEKVNYLKSIGIEEK